MNISEINIERECIYQSPTEADKATPLSRLRFIRRLMEKVPAAWIDMTTLSRCHFSGCALSHALLAGLDIGDRTPQYWGMDQGTLNALFMLAPGYTSSYCGGSQGLPAKQEFLERCDAVIATMEREEGKRPTPLARLSA